MFTSSPTVPNAGRVAGPVVGKPADWCGTPVPGTAPAVAPIAPHPLAEARRHVQDGISAFDAAAEALNPVVPMHLDVANPIGIDLTAAAANGQRGLASVDAALGLAHLMGSEARDAVQSAAREARAAQHLLLAGDGTPNAFRPVAGAFSAASNWLSIADVLLALQLRDPRAAH